jgi:hypothetical protein
MYEMNTWSSFSEPAYYEICVNGRLGLQSTVWFGDMMVTINEGATPPQTTIHGYIRDQAALYGLISRARDLGLTLVSVNRIELQEDIEREDSDCEMG